MPAVTSMNDIVVQARCLAAIAVRDILTMWRYRVNFVTMYVSAILLPLAYLGQAAGFAGDSAEAMASFSENSGTTQVAAFLYLGWSVYMWVSVVLWGPASALREEREQGSLEVILTSSVSRRTLLLGMSIGHLLPTLVMFAIVGTMLVVVFGLRVTALQAALGLLVIVASIPALFALSALLSSLTLASRDSEGVLAFIEGGVSILCGVTYPIVVLPQALQWISQALPPTETILMLRNALLSSEQLDDWWLRITYVLLFGVVGFFVGDRVLGYALKSAQTTGRLAQF